jgi:CubicO group peptidase (beta-lactamase class C family)
MLSMKTVDRLMVQALDQKIFPGAVLMVSAKGETRFQEAYGLANTFDRRPVTLKTVFDLASLTKPLATSLAIMRLVQTRCLELDRAVGSLLAPLSTGDKGDVRIAHLLSHTAGFPDYRPYYLTLAKLPVNERRPELTRLLAAEALVSAPGTKVCYSDLGFMVLQWVVETLTERRLDEWVRDTIYAPLGLASLFFVDLAKPRPVADYAATEVCPWRGKLIEGEVHDENAHVLGGIAGHAGLFGDAAAVHALLLELLRSYEGRGASGRFATGLVRRFFERYDGLDMGLGFDVPAPTDSSAGRRFARRSVGHLGFTGTSFWVDLERKVIAVLLTNRVHPSRNNDRIKAFRPVLHDTVMQALEPAGG